MKELGISGAGNPGELQPPRAFQFHDGTPEGEAEYFEAIAVIYEHKKQQVASEDGDHGYEDEDERFDEPLIHDNLQTESWHSYWQDLGTYYDTRLEARGFPKWNSLQKEEVIYEDIDWSLYPGAIKPTPIPERFIRSYAAADE